MPAPAGPIAISDAPRVSARGRRRVEIRRLPPAEKAQRRLVKNAIMFGVCIVVLVIVFYFLAR